MQQYKIFCQAFWRGADYEEFRREVLGDRFVLTNSRKEADIVLTSVFGSASIDPDQLNVQLSWESTHRDEKFDLSILSETPFDDNQIWCPMLLNSVPKDYTPGADTVRSFASCMVANVNYTDGAKKRFDFIKAFVERYSSYGLLIGGHNPLANVTVPFTRDAKLEWMQKNPCLFNLCPENNFKNGYITEKIRDAYLTKHIPIYWGDTEGYEQYVPEGSYIRIDMDEYEKTFEEIDAVASSPYRQRIMLDAAPTPYPKSGQQIIRDALLDLLDKRGK